MGVPTIERTGHRATIHLQRPDKRNRIEPDDLVALLDAFGQLDADPAVRVVVLAASGPSFCAGYHLGALADGTRAEVTFGQMCDRLAALRMPTIARIEGNVHGGGTDLALSCDLRVGEDHIELAMPAARLGLQYYGSGLQRFVTRLGPGPTKRLFLTGLPMDAAALHRVGYLDEVVPTGGAAARVDALADAIASLGPEAVARTKRAINGLADGSLDVEDVEASHRESLRSEEHAAAVAAVAARRR
jgi:enoyl-CoA hydratase